MEEKVRLETWEARELFIGTGVRRIERSPDDFFRDFVAPGLPVIIEGGARQWPAFEKWSDEYLLSTIPSDRKVSVALTPDGRADAVHGDRFCFPDTKSMTLKDFFDWPTSSAVAYLQAQNDSLPTEFCELAKDVNELAWARDAFGGLSPEATNLWIGDERAATSFHKDNVSRSRRTARRP